MHEKQVSCIGLDIGQTLLEKDTTKLNQTTRKLVGANNKYSMCYGIPNITCTIGCRTHNIQMGIPLKK